MNFNKFSKQVLDNIIFKKTDNDFEPFGETMKYLFYDSSYSKANWIGNEKDISLVVQRIFSEAIENISSLWASGIVSINFDYESAHYINLCEKAAFYEGQSFEVYDTDNGSMINKMSTLKNIPSLAEIILSSENRSKKLIEIVNSNEASDLRNFLHNFSESDSDLRDIYIKNAANLPSKKKWVDWLRFGGVSVVSSILGTVLTANPVIGTAIGMGIGVVDKVAGDTLINSMTGDYSLDSWFSYIEKRKS